MSRQLEKTTASEPKVTENTNSESDTASEDGFDLFDSDKFSSPFSEGEARRTPPSPLAQNRQAVTDWFYGIIADAQKTTPPDPHFGSHNLYQFLKSTPNISSLRRTLPPLISALLDPQSDHFPKDFTQFPGGQDWATLTIAERRILKILFLSPLLHKRPITVHEAVNRQRQQREAMLAAEEAAPNTIDTDKLIRICRAFEGPPANGKRPVADDAVSLSSCTVHEVLAGCKIPHAYGSRLFDLPQMVCTFADLPIDLRKKIHTHLAVQGHETDPQLDLEAHPNFIMMHHGATGAVDLQLIVNGIRISIDYKTMMAKSLKHEALVFTAIQAIAHGMFRGGDAKSQSDVEGRSILYDATMATPETFAALQYVLQDVLERVPALIASAFLIAKSKLAKARKAGSHVKKHEDALESLKDFTCALLETLGLVQPIQTLQGALDNAAAIREELLKIRDIDIKAQNLRTQVVFIAPLTDSKFAQLMEEQLGASNHYQRSAMEPLPADSGVAAHCENVLLFEFYSKHIAPLVARTEGLPETKKLAHALLGPMLHNLLTHDTTAAPEQPSRSIYMEIKNYHDCMGLIDNVLDDLERLVEGSFKEKLFAELKTLKEKQHSNLLDSCRNLLLKLSDAIGEASVVAVSYFHSILASCDHAADRLAVLDLFHCLYISSGRGMNLFKELANRLDNLASIVLLLAAHNINIKDFINRFKGILLNTKTASSARGAIRSLKNIEAFLRSLPIELLNQQHIDFIFEKFFNKYKTANDRKPSPIEEQVQNIVYCGAVQQGMNLSIEQFSQLYELIALCKPLPKELDDIRTTILEDETVTQCIFTADDAADELEVRYTQERLQEYFREQLYRAPSLDNTLEKYTSLKDEFLSLYKSGIIQNQRFLALIARMSMAYIHSIESTRDASRAAKAHQPFFQASAPTFANAFIFTKEILTAETPFNGDDPKRQSREVSALLVMLWPSLPKSIHFTEDEDELNQQAFKLTSLLFKAIIYTIERVNPYITKKVGKAGKAGAKALLDEMPTSLANFQFRESIKAISQPSRTRLFRSHSAECLATSTVAPQEEPSDLQPFIKKSI